MTENISASENWAKIVVVDGKKRILAYDGRWMDRHVPMSLESAIEALIQEAIREAALKQAVELIPANLRDQFVPQIKRINRNYLEAMADLMPEFGAFEQAMVSDDAAVAMLRKRMEVIGQEYVEGELRLERDFRFQGGTENQFRDLWQAVLNHHFSVNRPGPSTLPLVIAKSEPS